MRFGATTAVASSSNKSGAEPTSSRGRVEVATTSTSSTAMPDKADEADEVDEADETDKVDEADEVSCAVEPCAVRPEASTESEKAVEAVAKSWTRTMPCQCGGGVKRRAWTSVAASDARTYTQLFGGSGSATAFIKECWVKTS